MILLITLFFGQLIAPDPYMFLPNDLKTENLPKKTEYQEVLDNYQMWIKNFNKLEYYKDYKYISGLDEEKFKPTLDLFYLLQAKIILKELQIHRRDWKKEAVKLSIVVPMFDKVPEEIPTVKEIGEYNKKLDEMYSSFSKETEKYAIDILDKHKSFIRKYESKYFMRKLKEGT